MNKQVRVLLWGSNLWQFAAGLLGPLFAVFAVGLGGNILDITGAWAVYMIITGILTIYFGKIGDRIGHEKLMITGYALNAIFTFSYLLASSPVHLFIIQAGLGVALALSNPTWSALYDRYSVRENDGYLWGAALGQGNIATGIATIIGGLIVTYLSFNALFIIMGTIQLVSALLQLKLRQQNNLP